MINNIEFMDTERKNDKGFYNKDGKNSDSRLYTYYRCTIVNSKLPHYLKKHCTNISILYSKLEKYKSSLKLLPRIQKIEFAFIQNYERRYRF